MNMMIYLFLTIVPKVAFLLGVPPEDISQDDLERYEQIASHPVKINLCSHSKLLSSGLFTAYQAASIMDSRSRTGDILSITELGMLDGFGKETAEALEPFINLESDQLPGSLPSSAGLEGEIMARTSVRREDYTYGLKSRLSYGRLSAGAALRRGYGQHDLLPSARGGYIKYEGRKVSLTAGRMSVRFGQGLDLWSGFDITSLSTLDGFQKKGSGLNPSLSWSESSPLGAGLRADISPKLELSAFAADSEEGFLAGGNLSAFFRSGRVGFTTALKKGSLKLSSDCRLCLKGNDIYGELCYDVVKSAFEGTGGFVVPIGKARAGARFVSYQGRMSLAAGLKFGALDMATEYLEKKGEGKVKVLAQINPALSDRWIFKSRPYVTVGSSGMEKVSLRVDLGFKTETWAANFRTESVRSKKLGLMSYLEVGRTKGVLSFWLRGTLFSCNNWNDRIYCYERDAPGCFTTSLCYGSGWNASVYGILKSSSRLKAYLRASVVSYPWMKQKKPGTAELKLQLNYRF